MRAAQPTINAPWHGTTIITRWLLSCTLGCPDLCQRLSSSIITCRGALRDIEGREEAGEKAGHPRGSLRARRPPPRKPSGGRPFFYCGAATSSPPGPTFASTSLGHARPRTVCVLPRAAADPLFRQVLFPPVLWGRRGQPGPTYHGLGEGGLRCLSRLGAGSVLPPGHRPCEGCLRHAQQPSLPGLQEQGRGRVRPGIGLPERGCPVSEPPVQPPRQGGYQGISARLPDAGHRPGVARAREPMVDGPVRPLSQEVVLPQGRPVYLRGSTERVPSPRSWAFLMDSRPPQLLDLAAPLPAVASARTPTAPSFLRRGRLRPRTRARTS